MSASSPDLFVGRGVELQTLHQWFDLEARCVTLLGAAGVGKTRLANEFLSRERTRHGRWPGGVLSLDCTVVYSSVELQLALAHVFGVGLDSPQTVGPRMAHALRDRSATLLCLDNFEHLAREATSVVQNALEAGVSLCMLVTSRERLDIRWERVFELSPLPCEGDDSAALQLMLERVRAVGGVAQREWCQKIVQRLEGIPLAIELAARRARILSLQELSTRLEHSFDALGRAQHEGNERHATLDAALEWSWQLCSLDDQHALAACSVFHGGFELDAAHEVLGLPSLEHTLDRLQSLRDRSLLQPPLQLASGRTRYVLFESVREMARRKLSVLNEREACLRHAEHFVLHAQTVRERAGEWLACIEWLDRERPNLESAIEQMLRFGHAEIAAQLTLSLAPLLHARRGLPGFETRLDRVLAHARVPAVEQTDEVRAGEGRLSVAMQVQLLALKCLCLRYRGDPRALESQEMMVKTAWRVGETHEWARALGTLGAMFYETGNRRKGTLLLQRAVQTSRALGAVHMEGLQRANLGAIESYAGHDPTHRELREAIESLRRVGDLRMCALALNNLSFCQLEQQDDRAARESALQALAMAQRVHDQRSQGLAKLTLGSIALRESRWEHCDLEFERACQLLHAAGTPGGVVGVEARWGTAWLVRGDALRARQHLAQACDLARQAHNLVEWSEAMMIDVLALIVLGRVAEAQRCEQEARSCRAPPSDSFVRLVQAARAAASAKTALQCGEHSAAKDSLTHARETLDAMPSDERRGRFESRLLGAWLHRWIDSMHPPPDALAISTDGTWFREPAMKRFVRVDAMGPRGVLRVLLAASGGGPAHADVSLEAIASGVWPNEKLVPESLYNRVNVAVSALRALGLRAWLTRTEHGFSLARGQKVVACLPEARELWPKA